MSTSYVDATGTARLASEVEYTYDGLAAGVVSKGNIASENNRVSEAGNEWVTTLYRYDDQAAAGVTTGPGNVTSVEISSDPDRGERIVEFGGDIKLYPTAEVLPETTNRSGSLVQHRISMRHDMRHGAVYQRVGVYGTSAGDVSGGIFDSLGRPICEHEVGTSCVGTGFTGLTHYVYTYGTPGAANPLDRMNSVEVRRREPNAGEAIDGHDDYLMTKVYHDGLGRERIVINQQFVRAPGPGGAGEMEDVVLRHLSYGSHGQVAGEAEPYVLSAPLTLQPPAGLAMTSFDYTLNGNDDGYRDPLMRVFETTQVNGAKPRTYYLGNVMRTVDAMRTATSVGNHAVETYDEHGRAIVREVYNGDSGAVIAQINWTYDGADRVLTEWYGGDATTTMSKTYDLLGRRLTEDDPNSGLWASIYDDVGNALFVDDPEANQSVQSCYDALDRVVLTCSRSSDVYDPNLCGDSNRVCMREYRYFYDESDNVAGETNFGVDQLTTVEGPDSEHRYVYDLRRRVTVQEDTVQGIEATTRFAYRDDIDRMTGMTYPDGEIIAYGYDPAGQPVSISERAADGSSLTGYVTTAAYDFRGSPTYVQRANFTEDLYTYHDADHGFRMESFVSQRVAQNPGESPDKFVDLEYDAYDGMGRISSIDDTAWPSGDLSMSAGYLYDGAGRLTTVSGPNSESFEYSSDGNMLKLDQSPFTFDAQVQPGGAPHQARILTLGPGATINMNYDANGQRISKTSSNGSFLPQTYGYDAFGALRTLTVDGIPKTMGYDHAGQRVFESRQGLTRRFFGKYSESEDGLLIKHYYLGEHMVATRSDSAPHLSDASVTPPISLPPEVYWLVLSSAICLLVIPMGPQRVSLGMRVSSGGGVGAALLVASVVMPLGFGTACGGGASIRHLHLNQQGSPVAISKVGGDVDRLYRYSAYGQVRRYDSAGSPVGIDNESRREFTGYQTDNESELQYAGARFYDPATAQFLSLDPVEVFPNPYAYVGWDPINYTDPTGTTPIDWGFVLFALALVVMVAQAVVSAVQNGDVGYFFRDLVVGLAGLGVGTVAGAVLAPVLTAPGVAALGVGASAYGVATAGSTEGAIFAGIGLGLALGGLAHSYHMSGSQSQAGSGSDKISIFDDPDWASNAYATHDVFQAPPRSQWPAGATYWDPLEGFYYGTTDAFSPLDLIGGFGKAGFSALRHGYRFIRHGREFTFGKDLRIALFGNRTGHPTGRFPHYHRRVWNPKKPGQALPGQGIGRHRPWDSKPTDKSFRDRF